MTVADLIKALASEDPARLVVMAKDGEGNDYSPLSGTSRKSYRADTTWSGETGLEELTTEDIRQGYDEEDVISDGVPALVLWPVN